MPTNRAAIASTSPECSIDAFISFLKEFGYLEETVSFVEKNRPMLDHLEYDVGFDYRMERDGLKGLKSGYYGIF